MASNYPDESDETYDFLCTTCHSKDLDKKAVEFCLACCKYFCVDCLKSHNSSSALKDHRNKLLGGTCFVDMTKTRLQPASSVVHTSNDVIFGCNTCADGGRYNVGIEYCKECAEFLCDICLKGHNKWAKHSKKMLGKVFLGKMIDARKTISSDRSRSTKAPTPPSTQPVTEKKMHGEVGGKNKHGEVSGKNKHGEVSGKKMHGEVSGKMMHGEVSGKTTHREVSGNKLTPGMMVTSVDRKEKITILEKRDNEWRPWCRPWCWAFGVCSLPDGGWLVTDNYNMVLKRLDVSGSVVDRCTVPEDQCDVCFIHDHNVAAVATADTNTLELISLDRDMTLVRTIKTDDICFSVTYANNKLYVTSGGGKAIYEYDYSDGRLDRMICPRDSQGEERFSNTQHITSSENGCRLFMTDMSRGLFIIDTRTADVMQQVDVGQYPDGVCLGEDDGLFVVLYDDGTIIHLDRNGTKLGTVVTREMNEGHWPWCVSYDKRTARLAVTVGGDYMFVFHMK